MRIAAILTALLCVAPSLSATVLLPAEFREIVAGSQIIVHGRVTEVQSAWTQGRREIESLITVEVQAALRGTPSSSVTFRVPGGQVGRYRSVTIGAPEFRIGEEAVLFLRSRGPAVPQVFGLNQGVFRVRVDQRTGARLVALPALMSHGDAPQLVRRGDIDRQPLRLDEFSATVRSILGQGGAR